MVKRFLLAAALGAALAPAFRAQAERLTNATVVEMSKSGLGAAIIVKKINAAAGAFDVSAAALIELKKSGVDDAVIAAMIDRAAATPAETNAPATPAATPDPAPATPDASGYSDSQPLTLAFAPQTPPAPPTPKEALAAARTVALEKSSVNPSRQALEKELLKRPEWGRLNLSIVRYRESADLYIEIGFVHFSLITHRYVWRLYDRRTGLVIAAGETTSWGSLAKNLARDIGRKLDQIAAQ